jgi:hypothetical protein
MIDDTEFDKLPPAEQIAHLTRLASGMKPKDIARALVQEAGDADLARSQLQELRKLLDETEVFLMRQEGLPGLTHSDS